jgi:hypothetical protein
LSLFGEAFPSQLLIVSLSELPSQFGIRIWRNWRWNGRRWSRELRTTNSLFIYLFNGCITSSDRFLCQTLSSEKSPKVSGRSLGQYLELILLKDVLSSRSSPFTRFGFPIGGRSTAIQLQNGGVWVLASTPLTPGTKSKLDELGPVK